MIQYNLGMGYYIMDKTKNTRCENITLSILRMRVVSIVLNICLQKEDAVSRHAAEYLPTHYSV